MSDTRKRKRAIMVGSDEMRRSEGVTMEIRPLATNEGQAARSDDGRMSAELAEFVRDDKSIFLSTDVWVDAKAEARAIEVGIDIPRVALTFDNAAFYVSPDQAIDLVGAILKALPRETTEAFARTLVERLDADAMLDAADAALTREGAA